MKKLLAFTILASLAFAGALMADTSLWSDSFHFDGNAITEEPILLNPTDPLAYSSAMTEGEPKSLTITVEDSVNPDLSASIFADYYETAVEGTATWDYTDEDYKDFPTEDVYVLKETIESDTESKVFTRFVTILPEPAGLLLLGLTAAFFLRKRVKSLLVVVALLAVSAFSAKAESSVTEVSCMQMWPFDRSVIINFAVESDFTAGLEVKLYGSTDNGETSFDLTEKGTLTKDGSDGTLPGAGKYKAIWMPDETFYGVVTDGMKVRVEVEEVPVNYMVVDLTSGDISYLQDVPEGGWTDEYKTTKMAFRKIEAGTFTMGSPSDELGRDSGEVRHKVTLTKDFYIAVFQTTQKQYETITGVNPSKYKGDMRPVERVSYNMIRGANKGAGWPTNSNVDETSFMGKLRSKTSIAFDLPTEAQWEYACRAGTTTAWNNGTDIINTDEDPELKKLGRYFYNQNDGKDEYTQHTTVGLYLPNAWGLYDMHGNVWEWCLDGFGAYEGDATDPKGPAVVSYRVSRGGSFSHRAFFCRSAHRGSAEASYEDSVYGGSIGFRVALTIPNDKYMVVDLEHGDISYLTDIPKGGWTDEYKTTKMVLRKIEAGKFTMGSPSDELGRYDNEVQHEVTLTKDFYIGIFEATQKQYETITGVNPSKYKGDMRPVECVSYNMIRGEEKGAGWPVNNDVDEASFFGKLRAKTSKAFDLPTEAQWEYACRAGMTTALNNGTNLTNVYEDGNMNKLGRYFYDKEDGKGGYSSGTAPVGSYLPNAWGLYDMHGNVDEWCLDWCGSYEGDATDPKGPTEGDLRRWRGGRYGSYAENCRSASRSGSEPFSDYFSGGIRVVLVP